MKLVFRAATLASLAIAVVGSLPEKSAEARPLRSGPARADARSTAAVRFVTTPAGNAARYRVREQLVGVDLPNDAIGETSGVTGVIAADAKGQLIPAESKFTVDVSTLKSDKDRRDGFVRGRVLETREFPTVTFVPTSVTGLSLPLPRSGTRAFQVTGDLTVRGVTHPTTWNGTARFQPGKVTGSASTAFTFADFDITQPRVPVVLSVADTIRLEMDFSMAEQNSGQ